MYIARRNIPIPAIAVRSVDPVLIPSKMRLVISLSWLGPMTVNIVPMITRIDAATIAGTYGLM